MPFADFLRSKPVVAGACLLLLGAGIVTIPREILKLEQARSLGNGQLASLLGAPNATIATRAALAIGRTRQPAGAPLLAAHLSDPRPSVRAMSIYGLGVIGLGTDAVQIAKKARIDRSGAVRVAALDALGRYEAAKRLRGSVQALAESAAAFDLAKDPDPVVRGRAAITLNFFSTGPDAAAAAAALTTAMGVERSTYVRQRVMWTIFRQYATRVDRSVLAKALHDPDAVVRIEAVRAYGHLKGAAALAALQPLLADRSWRVQEQTRESIRVIEGKPMTDHLTAIPAGVRTPAPERDKLASLPVLPWPKIGGSPAPPNVMEAALGPDLEPVTATEMTSPAHGPHPRLRFVTTKGDFYVVLYPEWAPLTVANFMNLSARGFFDDNRWFRIVPDFVVQTGEKDDKKAPGPGYTIGAEENPLEQNSYVISMGLDYDEKTMTPKRDSAGSEYYITLSPQYHLDNDFTVFGRVTSGYDVLGRLIESDRVVRIERVPNADL